MKRIASLAQARPFAFVVGLFVVESALAVPFVLAFRVAGWDIEPLRLMIPIAQSAFMLWVIGAMGWWRETGFGTTVRNLPAYTAPVVMAFVPVLAYGSIEIASGPLLFYTLALFFTGVSEEALARGVAIHVLRPRGKVVALGAPAVLFSVIHFSNLAFADVSAAEMTSVLLQTFGFAILYGAVLLRTGNIVPLIVLHTLVDYFFVTSGSAGPFMVEPMSPVVSAAISVANLACGLYIARAVELQEERVTAGED